MNRRTFLKIAGMGSISIAAGCTSETEKTLFSLVEAPFDMVTGEARWYASTCRECPAGCGVIAKNREGRIIKVEGNPLHPVNKGTLCMRGQASLQGIYNPDRIKTPLIKEKDHWKKISFSKAASLLKEKAGQTAKKGEGSVCMLTEVVGGCLMKLMRKCLSRWQSHEYHVFEPFAYESLKAANEAVFGKKRLFSYRMEESDFLVSFGADFLETWLSPVEYARKFKEMHVFKDGKKALFFHISPYQSLTGTNADLWLSCRPGKEAAVALGLIRDARQQGRGRELPEKILASIDRLSSQYTKEKALQLSGVGAGQYDKLCAHLLRSQKPLILGAGSGAAGAGAYHANLASNILNIVLDPHLELFDFNQTHRIEQASTRFEIQNLIENLADKSGGLLFLNGVNPVYSFSPESGINEALQNESLFVVSFSNFMDETTSLSDLVFPVQLPLETWDEYSGKSNMLSMLQPAMAPLTKAPALGDVLLEAAGLEQNFKSHLLNELITNGSIRNEIDWSKTLQKGGIFEPQPHKNPGHTATQNEVNFLWERLDSVSLIKAFDSLNKPSTSDLLFLAAPSIRFFDGRGANKSWLCEIPDPLTQVAWQTPVLIHPDTLKKKDLAQEEIVTIQSRWGQLEAPVYESNHVRPGILLMYMGQGHKDYGRYAREIGINPIDLLPPDLEAVSGGPCFRADSVSLGKINEKTTLAHTDGSRFQHGRKIALSVELKELNQKTVHTKNNEHGGLSMWDFPLTLPIPSGYDRKRDIYPPPENDGYRWAMVVDLDKCIGCASCAVACYAENNLGIVGTEQIIKGREMAWLSVHRYLDPEQKEKVIFLPMMCQHCDNAPCESVCPVYAPHHSKEGLNNQIYNRCIGTRFCSQNCPYKVRRFNWFTWQWPEPLNFQLNPDVTVRSKGVMEKCSFCIQRIKEAHNAAKDRNRKILDGEIKPACLQACPTRAFTFGNILDEGSRVRRLAENARSYQVMGYLNTKPAVIYLKKVVQEI